MSSAGVPEPIAEGAFGAVFKVKWLDQDVVVKTSKVCFIGVIQLSSSLPLWKLSYLALQLDTVDARALDKELAVISKVPPHENVVRILGVCRDFTPTPGDRPTVGLVLEFCGGGSLRSHLQDRAKVRCFTCHAFN